MVTRNIAKAGSQETFRFTNTSFEKILFGFNIVSDAVNTDANGVDLSKVRVKITLLQDGLKTELCNSQLLPLHIHSLLSNRTSEKAINWADLGYSTASTLIKGTKIQTQTASLTSIYYLPVMVDFGSGIILKEGDVLEVEPQLAIDCFDANCDATSVCYIMPIEEVTKQVAIPRIETWVLPIDKQQFTQDLKDNVQKVTFINLDKAVSPATAPFTSYDVDSDRLDAKVLYNEAVAFKKINDIDNTATNSFVLLEGIDFDSVKVNIDLNTSNLTSGKNYLVVSGYLTDFSLTKRHLNRTAKHQMRLARKFN